MVGLLLISLDRVNKGWAIQTEGGGVMKVIDNLTAISIVAGDVLVELNYEV